MPCVNKPRTVAVGHAGLYNFGYFQAGLDEQVCMGDMYNVLNSCVLDRSTHRQIEEHHRVVLIFKGQIDKVEVIP
eukprot:XP_001705388.1 Hypothetical protein GL50803_39250 [Giardia lamblia ATCC 50803]